MEIEKLIADLDELLDRQDYPSARALLEDALNRYKALSDDAGALSVYNELMGFERQYGTPAAATAAAENALGLLYKLEIKNAAGAMIVLNAATVFSAAGKTDRALELYARAQVLFDRYYPAGDRAFAGLYNNMAGAYAAKGDDKKAEYYYERAAGLLRRYRDVCDLAVTYCNLAGLYRRQGKDESARAAILTAAAVLDVPPEKQDAYYRYTCRKCAAACRELGFEGMIKEQ
ncbi:MAG: tetratricopeptide repeat protein [Clostridia bacterium]|nr:tetratricopeptide repeat protein [Clostridia bacterium]